MSHQLTSVVPRIKENITLYFAHQKNPHDFFRYEGPEGKLVTTLGEDQGALALDITWGIPLHQLRTLGVDWQVQDTEDGMRPELETRGTQAENGWQDHDGFIGPIRPGRGPRSDPRGDFPTGPAVGEHIPDVRCSTTDGTSFNLQEHRGDRPAVFIFFRSAVW